MISSNLIKSDDELMIEIRQFDILRKRTQRRIHRELGKFLMISSNLIKSDDELMIEIRQFDILRKRTQRRIHRIKNN